MRLNVLSETGRDEEVTPVGLGKLYRLAESSEVAAAQLECREANAFKLARIKRAWERKVVATLLNEECVSSLELGSVEHGFDSPDGFETQTMQNPSPTDNRPTAASPVPSAWADHTRASVSDAPSKTSDTSIQAGV